MSISQIFIICLISSMVPSCVLMSYKITFSLVVIVTAWQGDLSRAFSEGGVSEKVNFKGL